MNVHKKEKKKITLFFCMHLYILLYIKQKKSRKRTRTESRSTKINVAHNKALLRFSQ